MQSFLQYRRFGKHVKAQYDRDRSKAEALGNPDTSESTSPSSSSTNATRPATGDGLVDAQDHVDRRDPEKAEQSRGVDEPIESEDYATLDREKTGEQSGRYEPIRATPSGRQGSVACEEPTRMSRASTITTRQSLGTALGTTLTGIDARDRSTKEGGEGKVFVVGYEGEKDILNPHNWSLVTRFGATYVPFTGTTGSNG